MKTCKTEVEAWKEGRPVTTVNVSGAAPAYENGCLRIMFAAIGEKLDFEGDESYWDDLVGSDPDTVFPNASRMCVDSGMTGAMWGFSVSAAVVFLRNGWEKAIELCPKDRLQTVSMLPLD